MSNVTRTYFMLNVEDMGRAVAFYKEVLGPVIRYESETWTEIKIGDATVALHAGGGAPKPSGLTVEVLDLDEACEAIARMGGALVEGPKAEGTMRFAEVADSEGNGFTVVTG